jgi:prepilin-type N-terminal cleavage/methylation domain-containing protein
MKMKEGFTLIELIVALVFFGVASASIALFYANNSTRLARSEKTARLEVVAEKTYEEFKGILMERMYTPDYEYENLVFDSIWHTYTEGQVIYTVTDTIKGILFNSDIILDSFQFDVNKSYYPGSRMWVTVKSKNLSEGDSIKMRMIFSHHR